LFLRIFGNIWGRDRERFDRQIMPTNGFLLNRFSSELTGSLGLGIFPRAYVKIKPGRFNAEETVEDDV